MIIAHIFRKTLSVNFIVENVCWFVKVKFIKQKQL